MFTFSSFVNINKKYQKNLTDKEQNEAMFNLIQEIQALMKLLDKQPIKKKYPTQLYWKLNSIMELCCSCPKFQSDSLAAAHVFINLREQVQSLRLKIEDLEQKGYFNQFNEDNNQFEDLLENDYKKLIESDFNHYMKLAVEYIHGFHDIKLIQQKCAQHSQFNFPEIKKHDQQVTEALKKFNKVKCAQGLNECIKSEMTLLLFYNGGYETLNNITYEDFYSFLKEYVSTVENLELSDSIHKNKIQFYVDQKQQNMITPESASDFFDICWNNPKDRELLLSSKEFDWDNFGDNKKSLTLEVVKLTDKCSNDPEGLLKLGQKIFIDKKGLIGSDNYGTGIVRVGRASTSQPIVNDIYTPRKETCISRRQLMISYNIQADFRFCCSSTTSSTEILLKDGDNNKMYKDKLYKISNNGFSCVVDYICQPQEEEIDDYEEIHTQGQTQMNTIQLRKFHKNALNQLPDKFEKNQVTQMLNIQKQQMEYSQMIFDNGISQNQDDCSEEKTQQLKKKRTDIESLTKPLKGLGGQNEQSQKIIEEDDELGETVDFKEEQQKQSMIKDLSLNPNYGEYLKQWVSINCRYFTKNEMGAKEYFDKNIVLRLYEKKQIYSFGKANTCDFCFPTLPYDIQFYVYNEENQWKIRSAVQLDLEDQSTYLAVQFKKVKQLLEHKPSNLYKLEDKTLIALPGPNILKIHYNQEENGQHQGEEEEKKNGEEEEYKNQDNEDLLISDIAEDVENIKISNINPNNPQALFSQTTYQDQFTKDLLEKQKNSKH